MYRIYFNTGDYEWDNTPEIITCNTIEEVKKIITEEMEETEPNITEENIHELEEKGSTHDEEDIYWEVEKI